MTKTFPAKYKGKCACGAAVAPGQMIRHSMSAGVVGCPACTPAPIVPQNLRHQYTGKPQWWEQ